MSGDWREGEWVERDMSKIWEINPALEPLTGMPVALEGSSMHTARGLRLKNPLSKIEAAPTGFQKARHYSRAPWGQKSKERMCLKRMF